ncbi:MAG: RNA polymerase sigma factor [Ktedonobacteraceae bacterium]|nr:RNA polymerase sigma factor [Ktedonobacteraceae bacterium]
MGQLIMQGLEGQLQNERPRIIGLCATLTGNASVAEDLAQEVFLEAWRGQDRLRDTTLFSHWLSGIARNVCLRWARKHSRDLTTSLALSQAPEEQFIDSFDLEVELERKELAELLDRALAALPAETRAVLIARYIEESPLAELAQRFGLQTSTVAMRLQRGKLALRRALQQDNALESQGLPCAREYQETSAWCTMCGRHRLVGLFKPEEDLLILSCPECGNYNRSSFANTSEAGLLQGIKRVKPALTRLGGWINRFYSTYLETQKAPCLRCGQMIPMRIISSFHELDDASRRAIEPGWRDMRAVLQHCPTCDLYNWTALEGLALSLPNGQRFQREHTRLRELPEQEVEMDGVPAIINRFESLDSQARYEVVSARDTFRTLLVNGRRP